MHTIQCVYCDEALVGKTQAGAMTAFRKHVQKQHSETLEVMRRDVKNEPAELDVSK